ncbi:MAG: aldehyde dehydrogenase family protein [Pseudomonadota bacterium]
MHCRSYIDGVWVESATQPVALGNPADSRQIVSRTQHATPEAAAKAVAVAANAWRGWRRTSPERRVAVLQELLLSIGDNRGALALAISSETGKTKAEADQEVDATLNEARIQIGVFNSVCNDRGDIGNTGTIGEDRRTLYEPLGAVLLVTPFNFPLAALMRKLVPALLLGNGVVVKASELTPATSCQLFDLIDSSSLPRGVVNLVLADGRTVVRRMLDVEDIAAVSLTGSNAAGDAVAAAIGARDVRLQAEMGGSNAVVVLRDADLDAAAAAIVEHGFACCGQWCTGTTRIIIDAPAYDEMLGLLADRIGTIVVGPASNSAATMGPLISASQRQRVEAAIAVLTESGARLVCGGKRPEGEEFAHGYFLEPTLLADIEDQSALCRQEIFGPVLAVVKAESRDDALRKANEGPYGLSFSIYTSDLQTAEAFVDEVDCGLCHINLPTGHRHSAMPLAGWKTSGRGMPECGRFALDFFSRTKAVYCASR